jgi:hypothetical protein
MQDLTLAAAPGAVRLPEVVNAVLDVLDARAVKPSQRVSFVEIEVGMDARGYAIKWVRRAVEVLVDMGALQSVDDRVYVVAAFEDPGGRKRPSHRSRPHRLKVRSRANG